MPFRKIFGVVCTIFGFVGPFWPLISGNVNFGRVFLRSFACFCERPRLERPRLGTAEHIEDLMVFAERSNTAKTSMGNLRSRLPFRTLEAQ